MTTADAGFQAHHYAYDPNTDMMAIKLDTIVHPLSHFGNAQK
jgi:hypothetical protein